jgi:hypothetical protein
MHDPDDHCIRFFCTDEWHVYIPHESHFGQGAVNKGRHVRDESAKSTSEVALTNVSAIVTCYQDELAAPPKDRSFAFI